MESQQQNWHQRRMRWASRLEEVLNDFDALQLFQSWMGVDDDSSEHPLRLHFAIVAFREMLARADSRAGQLAREIYNKFLRPKSGLCAFIDASIRERVGQRLRHLGPGGHCQAELFQECLLPLENFLRRQHAIFVSSQEFLDKFNTSTCLDELPPPAASSSSVQKTPARKSRRQHESQEGSRPALTADMLLRSQKEREAMVPAGAASQRLFKPVSKLPYVGQAQPSKNDSAVSSAFSSEANRAGGSRPSHSLRLIRDEQRRVNPPMMATFPRPDQVLNESNQSSAANQFRHDTVEGRQQFAELLQRKLQAVQRLHQQEESVKEQIELINSARQKGAKQSARELIGQGPELLEDSAGVDADEELEAYYRLKMAADSNSSANSAQQSPLVPLSRRTRRRSRGHGSCSPGAERAPQLVEWGYRTGGPFAVMSQSCCSANASSLAFLGGQPLPPSFGQHFPLLESAERSFLPFPQQMPGPHLAMGGGGPFASSSPFSQMCSNMAAGLGQPTAPAHPAHAPLPPAPPLSQSVHLGPAPSSVAQPKAPMGQKSNKPIYCDNDGDTSGIGSMTSATHSGTSAPGTAEQRERQRAAVFRKARELSSGGGTTERQQQGQGQGGCSSSFCSSSSAIPRQRQRPGEQCQQQPSPHSASSQLGSIPRPRMTLPPGQPQAMLAQQCPPAPAKMAISFREAGGDRVPVVAQIPQKQLTFREFRRILSISSKDRRQFFFKVACEDGSAPYQLLLVNDDHSILPIFDGKITADCRAPLSDSD